MRNGDTLQSIASIVWGDSAMWYLLADANGLGSNETLTTGQVLTIPNKVTNLHNTSGTFRPYNAGEAVGDTSPTIPTAPPPPQPKKKGCGGLGAILVAIVTIAVSVVASSYGIPPVWAAALGNVAGQATGNVLGVQNGFSVKSLATSMISAGITEGLIGGAKLPNGTTSAGLFGEKLGGLVGGGYAEVAARAVTSNVIGQGVGNLTGQQKGFSWSSVAAAGVGAAAGGYIGDKIGTALGQAGSFINGTTQLTKGAGFVTTAAQGITASLVSQATQIALDGRGRLNWANVAINGVSAGVGYLAGYNDPKYGGMPKAFGQGNLGNVEAQIANGQRYAEFTKGTSTDAITLPKIPVTPTPRPLLDEVTETADRLMQLNSQYNPAMIAGKYTVGAAEMVGAGVYNEGVRIVGGLVSIPAAFISADAAVSIQNSVNERLSYTLRSSGAQSIGRAIQPLANAIDSGMQSARSYSESRIGNGATAVLFGTAEFALEAGGLVTGGVAARIAIGRLGRTEVATTQEFVGPGIGKSGYQSSAEFADVVGAKYQRFVDDAYVAGQRLEGKGLLRGLSSTRLGDYVDRISARDLKLFLKAEGISEGSGNLIQMNRFLRDPAGSGLYVRPDVSIPSAGRIFDATVGFKSYNDKQIQRFNQFSGGSYITNVRPSTSPLGGSYSFDPSLFNKGN